MKSNFSFTFLASIVAPLTFLQGVAEGMTQPCVAEGFIVAKDSPFDQTVYVGPNDGDIILNAAEIDEEAYCSKVGCVGEYWSMIIPGRIDEEGNSVMTLNVLQEDDESYGLQSSYEYISYHVGCASQSASMSMSGPGSQICTNEYRELVRGPFATVYATGCSSSLLTVEFTCTETDQDKPKRHHTESSKKDCAKNTPSGVFLVSVDIDGYAYHGRDDGDIEVYMASGDNEAGCNKNMCVGEDRVYGIPGRDDGAGGKSLTFIVGSDTVSRTDVQFVCPDRSHVMTITIVATTVLGSCTEVLADEKTSGPVGYFVGRCNNTFSQSVPLDDYYGFEAEMEISCLNPKE